MGGAGSFWVEGTPQSRPSGPPSATPCWLSSSTRHTQGGSTGLAVWAAAGARPPSPHTPRGPPPPRGPAPWAPLCGLRPRHPVLPALSAGLSPPPLPFSPAPGRLPASCLSVARTHLRAHSLTRRLGGSHRDPALPPDLVTCRRRDPQAMRCQAVGQGRQQRAGARPASPGRVSRGPRSRWSPQSWERKTGRPRQAGAGLPFVSGSRRSPSSSQQWRT